MKVAYDLTLMRPGCAIVQAGVGGDLGIANHFDGEDWVVYLSPDMRLYEVDADQLALLVEQTRQARP